MTLLDTNILVYAVNEDSEFHKTASEIHSKVLDGSIQACISLQNLIEFYSIITSNRVQNPLPAKIAFDEIDKYIADQRIKKIQFNGDALVALRELAIKYNVTAQNIYDLKIVATMLVNNIGKIITANERDFKKFSEIKIVNPFPV